MQLMGGVATYVSPESDPPLVLVSSSFSVEPVAGALGLVPEWALGLVLELDLVGGPALVVHQPGHHLKSVWNQ